MRCTASARAWPRSGVAAAADALPHAFRARRRASSPRPTRRSCKRSTSSSRRSPRVSSRTCSRRPPMAPSWSTAQRTSTASRRAQIGAAAQAATARGLKRQVGHHAAEHHQPAARSRSSPTARCASASTGLHQPRPRRCDRQHAVIAAAGEAARRARDAARLTRTMPPTCSRTNPPARPRRCRR